ncbi:MAG: RNA-binding transcriptional accessory protein [Bacteroidales bacterium]|jgi:uncharacterized protein|nr:RNA-binding transcriptional accessory protein [Bacteroidales bacterium]
MFKKLISIQTSIPEPRIARTLELIDDGATIPFISRYRKEATGGLDEVQIGDIKQQYERLKELANRKNTVLAAIEDQGKLTDSLKHRIEDTWDAAELEDIYLPFKPKKQTKAELARKHGLEPLAAELMQQFNFDIYKKAQLFINQDVDDADAALQGARDIIAEWVNESEVARKLVRNSFQHHAIIAAKVVKGKEDEAAKYRDYFTFSEPLFKCAAHRLLAMRRGETEGFLRVSISTDDAKCLEKLQRRFVRGHSAASRQVEMAVSDSYKRLLKPSIETEFAATSKEKADMQAIRVFAENLKQLLLAPPLGQKRVMGIDPGFRTGCKVVCLDAQGNLLHHDAIFPHPPQNERQNARSQLAAMATKYGVEAVAVGNGTAGRETEELVNRVDFGRPIPVFMVSEDGASVYSASKIAREEFPNHDVTVRGAVSIARRLIDPLAELVKIDPKSIGVGQYQHDVNQTDLKAALDQTVENCVNRVGVNLNTASKHLLVYVSGLGPSLAQNIVDYRAEHGTFKNRKELLKVPRLGPKAFEQAAGFLRIPDASNPLDNSAVHPESYHIVETMAKDMNCKVADLIADKTRRDSIPLEKYMTDSIGMPTLTDIMAELAKPGRDPRTDVAIFAFDPNVRTIHDITEGQILQGIVSNITNFGCFVDIGIKEKGLVHLSNMANKYITSPTEVVHLHQPVQVKVLEIDLARKRIALSMKDA